MHRYVVFSFFTSIIAAGCSGSDLPAFPAGAAGATTGAGGASGSSGAAGEGNGGSAPDAGADSSVPGESYSLTFGPVKVPSGTERTQCVVKRLGNPKELYVGKIHNVLNGPSHHLIVYRTNDTEEKLTPFDCQPFTDTLDPSKGSPLMITQKHEELLELPKGVAFKLAENQMFRLEMHYVNASFEDIDVTATSTFITMPEAEFENEADFLFIGNPDIKIAANAKASLGPTFLEVPSVLYGSKFFGVTGHTHQWGTNVTVAVASSEAGADTTIYDVPNWSWSEPATVYMDPPITLPEGGGFRFTCSWENKSPKSVGFGESASDEMCFFWAYYYPSKGAYVCAHTDQFAGGYDLCCPGNPFCDMIF